jgi:hypothetical protein
LFCKENNSKEREKMIAISIGIGAFLSFVIIIVANKLVPRQVQMVAHKKDDDSDQPKSEPDVSNNDSSHGKIDNNDNTDNTENKEKDVVDSDASTAVSTDASDEKKKMEYFADRLKALEKIYGRQNDTEEPSNINWVKLLDWMIFIGLVVAFLVVSKYNVADSDFMRFLAGIFPREFETLGLTRYLAAHQRSGVVPAARHHELTSSSEPVSREF